MPTYIGKYEVEAEIGCGILVKMFRAQDRDTGRTVALKVLAGGRERRLVELFRREIAIAAGIRHKNIVAIYELGEHAGWPFAATQYLDGNDLRLAIHQQSSLTLLQKLMILWQVGEGLRAAHHGGLAYVGVRPSGIMVADDGSVTIRDFSIVRLLGGGEDEDVSYTSPEEISSGFSPDSLCDVFALGAIYYELLTGVHPFLSESGIDIQKKEPVPLRRLAPEAPEALEQLVHRAVNKDRELRYPGVDDVQDDVEPILSDLKRAGARMLLIRAREMQREPEPEPNLDQLQSIIREALVLDPGNHEVRQLQGTLRAEQQRRALATRVETLFREADEEAAARAFARAVEILHSAVQLDPSNPEAGRRLEQMCARLEQYQSAAQLVSDARRLMVEENLAEAQAKVAAALATYPEYREAAELLAAIGESLDRRAKEARIEREVAKADALFREESYDAAISILLRLRTECGESELVELRLARAEAEKAEQERRSRLQRETSAIRALLAGEQFAEALTNAEALAAEFPEDGMVASLHAQASQAVKRATVLADVKASCDELCRLADFENALRILDAALASYAGDPTLVALRREVEEQQRVSQTATAIRRALEEAQWLLDQDRPDLAADFLRGRAAELPGQPHLAARLEAVEQLLPDWERRRLVQDTLGRVAALEQSQQPSVALALIEQVLAVYPASEELVEAAGRLRCRQQEDERHRKLARRLETIRQKIAAEAWPQAISLAEAAQAEFADEPEFERICAAAHAGLRRSECEVIVIEVRHCLSEGEIARAEEILRKGLASLPGDPALEALREELEADKKYREDWHLAQALFGRRQFREAEEILSRLAGPDRPDALALLNTVRGIRAASEEDNFFKRGREQAQMLIEQKQFEQAADLLRNLLTLFPGNSILERDLQSAEAGLDKPALSPDHTPPAAAPPAEVYAEARTVMPRPEPAAKTTAPARIVWAAIATSVLLPSAGLAVWKFWPSQRAIASSTLPPPAATPPRVTEEPARVTTQVDALPTPARVQPQQSKSTPLPSPSPQPFTPPTDARSEVASAQAAPSLPPPGTDPLPARQEAPALPAYHVNVAAPPPPPTPSPTPTPVVQAPPTVQATPVPQLGGTVVEPKVISHPAPVVPPLSALRGIYGDVMLEATIDPAGNVAGLRVVSGHPILAAAAKAAVTKWRYQPGTLNGHPIAMKVQVQVSFQNHK